MRKIVLLLLTLFTSAGLAEARQQDSAPLLKKWDAAVTIAAAHVRPAHNEGPYYDNWFFEGRYAGQIGRYLTEHIKTEMEYARFGEGSIFFQGYQRLAGTTDTFPYTLESKHQLQQLQFRMAYQFGQNAWVHPYVSAGVFGTRDDRTLRSGAQYLPTAVGFIATDDDPSSDDRGASDFGVIAAAGAKVYVARHGFINTGLNWTHGDQQTFNLFAGVGIDF